MSGRKMLLFITPLLLYERTLEEKKKEQSGN